MSNYTITGHDAIAYATAKGITLGKYADPTEGARDGLSITEAREIAAEDPSLIYLTLTGWTGDHDGYDAGCYFACGEYLGADADGIEPIFA